MRWVMLIKLPTFWISVVQNFAEYPDIVAEASSELARIKNEESKRNASVNPDGN